jgi:glycine/D-amino acid oxidase-like deaminating enzyme
MPKTAILEKDVMLWNTANPYLYMRKTSDGRIIVGGRDENFTDPRRRDKLIEKKSKLLVKDFNKLFPDIKFNAEFSWTGTFGSTVDGLPFIGQHSKFPNTYFALGFGGNGITFSLIAAEIIRDLIMGKKNPDAGIFSFDRL